MTVAMSTSSRCQPPHRTTPRGHGRARQETRPVHTIHRSSWTRKARSSTAADSGRQAGRSAAVLAAWRSTMRARRHAAALCIVRSAPHKRELMRHDERVNRWEAAPEARPESGCVGSIGCAHGRLTIVAAPICGVCPVVHSARLAGVRGAIGVQFETAGIGCQLLPWQGRAPPTRPRPRRDPTCTLVQLARPPPFSPNASGDSPCSGTISRANAGLRRSRRT